MPKTPELEDTRLAATLTVAELRRIVRDEIEGVLGATRGVPNPLLTPAEVCELLRISEKTLATMRAHGDLPTIWVTPDAPRFDRAEMLAWVRETSAYLQANKDKSGDSEG
jgi:hypothetical protein